MGGSEKAEDETKIGLYCSGLKHAIALFLRNNVEMSIKVYDTEFSDNHDRKRVTNYHIGTYIETCEQTEKEKELIQIHRNVVAENFHSGNCSDYGGGEYPEEILQTGFSVKLGVDWVLFMGLREIYSNMVDEGGYYTEVPTELKYGTVIELKFEEDSEFSEIWDNKHLYINEQEPLFIVSNRVEALDNPERYLRIYKQNILVYEDKERPSNYAYNIHFGQLDEKRVLSNIYSVEGEIISAIANTKNEEFLRTIIRPDFQTADREFLSSYSYYSTASELVHNIATEVYEQHGVVQSYDWLINAIKKRKDCRIAGKIITTVSDSVWSYSTDVKVESKPETISEPDMEVEEVIYSSSFSAEIKKHYNFNLDVEVRQAKLKGSRCVADKFEKCIIVDEDFNLEADFPTFLVEYVDLTREGNVVTNLGKYICELLKK